MSKIHFITYGSDKYWIYALDRIAHEAKKCGVFDSVTCYTPGMLDPDFAERYAPVLAQPRGGGYWIWKPQIIRQKLDEVGDGDAVVYADAGCRLRHKNTAELLQHIGKLRSVPPPLANYGMLAVRRGDRGDKYMTNQLISYFKKTYGIDDAYKTACGFNGSALIFLKNDRAYKILDGFERLLQTDMMLITDAYNHLPQHPNFHGDSRHDQTILSLLGLVFGCVRLNQIKAWWKRPDYFFATTRMRFRASASGLFRVHGIRAPLYFADYLIGNLFNCLNELARYIKNYRLRAPYELARNYRWNRRVQVGFYIDTSYSLTRYLRGAFLKIKREGG